MSADKPDELTLEVGGVVLSGWTEVHVARGVERCPTYFEIATTERYPEASEITVKSGDPCAIRIGQDLVATGYVDRVIRSVDAESHEVRIVGRGKCQDLVDCSAEWAGCEINQANVLDVATKLAAPYGISVSTLYSPDLGAPLPAFQVTVTESAFSIIEEMARYYAVLAYEQPDGNLVIAAVGKARAASGFKEGSNVQKAQFTDASDERFSDYKAFLMSMDVLSDLGNGGNLKASTTDPNVRRHRLHAIVAESPSGGQDIALKRVLWEAARRAGRGAVIHLTADSWRDGGGVLWTPNTLAAVDLPSLKVPSGDYCIGEVTYLMSGTGGTTAELTLMPAGAYAPEPILLQPALADISAANAQ